MKKLIGSLLLLFSMGCGDQAADIAPPERQPSPHEQEIEDLKNQILLLTGTVTEINNMVLSDFATCAGSGDASDALINKICKVAQASTVEAKVEMKSELNSFANSLEEKLGYVNEDLSAIIDDLDGISFATMASDIAQLQTDVSTINSTLTSLDTRMTDAENAITALENLTASISGALAGTVGEIQIGNENISAGPIYESLLKRTDNTGISGYIEAFGSDVAMANNAASTTSGSATITFTTSVAHGLAIGDRVLVSDLKNGKGWAAAEINGEFTVDTVPSTTTFTVTMSRNATKTGTFGSSNGVVKEVLGRGLGLVWSSGDGDDVAVRTANPRGKSYTFIIVEDGSGEGWVCYDTTDSSANFATLSGAGCQTDGVAAGNCVCK